MLVFLALESLITISMPLEQPVLLGQRDDSWLHHFADYSGDPSDLPWRFYPSLSFISHLCHFTVYKVLLCPVLDSHLLAHKLRPFHAVIICPKLMATEGKSRF